MRKKSVATRSAALFLSLCMVFGLAVMTPAAALADGEGSGTGTAGTSGEVGLAEAGEGGGQTPGSGDGSSSWDNIDPSTYVLSIVADEKNEIYDNSFGQETNGNGILVQASNGYTGQAGVFTLGNGDSVDAGNYGVTLTSDGASSQANVRLDGPVVAGNDALSVKTTNSGTANVTANSLHADAGGDGLKVHASGSSTANVITGEISAKETAVDITATSGATADVKVGTNGTAVKSEDLGVVVTADGQSTRVDLSLDKPVESEGDALSVKATNGTSVDVMAGSMESKSGDGVLVDASGESWTEVYAGDITAKGTGVTITAQSGATAEVKPGGALNAGSIGAVVIADGQSTQARLEVEGAVQSEGDALSIGVMNGGTANISVGSVEAKSDGGGISVEASGISEANIKTGAVTAGGTGVTISADSGASVEVKAGGAVNAGQDGVSILANGEGTQVVISATQEIDAVNKGLDIEASDGGQVGGVVGSVTSTGENAFGVWIRTEESSFGSAATTIPDTLSAISFSPHAEDGSDWHTVLEEADDPGTATQAAVYADDVTAYAGVHVEAAGGAADLKAGKVTVSGGNVKDDSLPVEDRSANSFAAIDGGVVTGDLDSVESKAGGVDLFIRSGGAANVNVGTIEAGQIGIRIDNEGGTTWTDVGSITSNMEGIGVTLVGDNSVSFAFVDGNLISTGESAIKIDNDGGHVLIAVAGDAASTADGPNYLKQAGLDFSGSGETKVLVVGTLSGANGVQIEEGAEAKDLDLTVWTIQANDGKVIAGDDAEGSFAKGISYIVMLEQPTAGATVIAVKEDGSPLDRRYADGDTTGFEVANQDQKVLLKVNLEKGYTITGVYNGMENRVALQQDEAGNYFLAVPLGGGVYFTVDLSMVPEPAPQPVLASQPVQTAAAAAEQTASIWVPNEGAIAASIVGENDTPVKASIRTRFYGDGRFAVVINGGALRVRGSFKAVNGILTLVLADGTQIPIGSDGTFRIPLEDGTILVLRLEDALVQQLMKI